MHRGDALFSECVPLLYLIDKSTQKSNGFDKSKVPALDCR